VALADELTFPARPAGRTLVSRDSARASDHPLAGRSQVALHELAGEPLLVRPHSDGYGTTVIGACRAAGFQPELLGTPVHGNPALRPSPGYLVW